MLNIQDFRSRVSELSVLVVGDYYLDRDCVGEYLGYSREKESLPIFRISQVDYKPGGAGNLASNFAALGVRTKIAGVWGDSEDWNRVMHANSAYLCDWREHDGHFYLFYAGANDDVSFERRGHGKIGVVRSRDLIDWRLPGDTGGPD